MRTKLWMLYTALLLAEISATFESSMIYGALPTLIREFGDPVKAGWLVTSHLLIGAAAAVMAGRLGDIYGRKKVVLILLMVATVGSILSAVTSDYALVLTGRALQGLSIGILPLVIGILRESAPPEKLPVAIGLMSTGMGAGAAIGLVLGGYIVDTMPWHWLFVASAVLLLISWVAVRFMVPTVPGTPPRFPIDWVEGLMPVPGITAILLGISFSKESGWLSPLVLGTLGAGIVIMSLWARRSLSKEEPFIDLRILAIPNVAIANVLVVLLALGTMQIIFVFSNYIQSPSWTMVGLGLSATVAGLAKLPSNMLSLLAGPFSGWLFQKFGMKLPVFIGGGMAAAGWAFGVTLPASIEVVVVLLCVISFGTTILNAAIPNIIVASVPENRTSEAVGTMQVIRGMASAIGAQFVALFLALSTMEAPDGSADFPSAAGFQLTMGWIAALTAGATLLAIILRRPKTPASEPDHPDR